jgi:mersacidin/lichenicidin family type 2 lantibiotic
VSNLNIIRAWKDEEYRMSLSAAERDQLPAHPAGLIELSDAELGRISGSLMSQGLPETYETKCSLGYRCVTTSWSC